MGVMGVGCCREACICRELSCSRQEEKTPNECFKAKPNLKTVVRRDGGELETEERMLLIQLALKKKKHGRKWWNRGGTC